MTYNDNEAYICYDEKHKFWYLTQIINGHSIFLHKDGKWKNFLGIGENVNGCYLTQNEAIWTKDIYAHE